VLPSCAANWVPLGLTKGRGKDDQTKRQNRSLKLLFGYPLVRDYRVRSRRGRRRAIARRVYGGGPAMSAFAVKPVVVDLDMAVVERCARNAYAARSATTTTCVFRASSTPSST